MDQPRRQPVSFKIVSGVLKRGGPPAKPSILSRKLHGRSSKSMILPSDYSAATATTRSGRKQQQPTRRRDTSPSIERRSDLAASLAVVLRNGAIKTFKSFSPLSGFMNLGISGRTALTRQMKFSATAKRNYLIVFAMFGYGATKREISALVVKDVEVRNASVAFVHHC